MWPGRSAQAQRPEDRASTRSETPTSGGSTFAENPERAAPDARIIWHADLDPGALRASAVPAPSADPDAIDAMSLRPWLTIATGGDGTEHVVLSDGWRHVRIDIEEGSLAAGSPVVLHYRLAGVAGAETKLLPLRRLIYLCRHRRFARSLFPREARIARHLMALRVHDALAAGASQREIAEILFRANPADLGYDGRSDSLRSRVRRLAREARRMADGGWRMLLLRSGNR